MHRFYIPRPLSQSEPLTLRDPKFIHQLSRVLRMKVGDSIVCFDGFGHEYVVELQTFAHKEIIGAVTKIRPCETEISQEISVYQAVPKKLERFEFMLQKCTELGARKFFPLVTERTEGTIRNPERLRKIIIEAVEQCGGCIVPELFDSMRLEDVIKNPPQGFLIAGHESTDRTFRDIAEEAKSAPKISLFIGPEGGFSDAEVDCFKNSNIQVVQFGKRVLRTETAALAMISAILYS